MSICCKLNVAVLRCFPSSLKLLSSRSLCSTKLQQYRSFSQVSRGYDLTSESLSFKPSSSTSSGSSLLDLAPKIVVSGYSSVGFEVLNALKLNDNTKDKSDVGDGSLYMNGSILAFPQGCFLWNVSDAPNVTFESLVPVLLHKPKPDYLFIGWNNNNNNRGNAFRREEVDRIKREFRKYDIIVEVMTLHNAIGTFNLLNAEDRLVAAALLIDKDDEDDDNDIQENMVNPPPP